MQGKTTQSYPFRTQRKFEVKNCSELFCCLYIVLLTWLCRSRVSFYKSCCNIFLWQAFCSRRLSVEQLAFDKHCKTISIPHIVRDYWQVSIHSNCSGTGNSSSTKHNMVLAVISIHVESCTSGHDTSAAVLWTDLSCLMWQIMFIELKWIDPVMVDRIDIHVYTHTYM